jgi:hypothetical protein
MCMKLVVYSSRTRGFDGQNFVVRTVNRNQRCPSMSSLHLVLHNKTYFSLKYLSFKVQVLTGYFIMQDRLSLKNMSQSNDYSALKLKQTSNLYLAAS